MKVVRNILITLVAVILVAAIAAGGFIYYKSRPVLNAYKVLSTAESFDYTVRLHVGTPAVSVSSGDSTKEKVLGAAKSLLFAMRESDWIDLEGEYRDQVFHCECMSGDYEDPILEFWYQLDAGADGEDDVVTLNFAPTIKCVLTKLASVNSLTALVMEKLTENLTDMVITDTQLSAVTGREALPDIPEIPTISKKDLILVSLTSTDVKSDYFDSAEMEGKKYISFNTADGKTVTIGIGSVTTEETDNGKVDSVQLYLAAEIDGCPCEAMINLTIPSSAGSITVPESKLTDDQLQVLGQIYGTVEQYLQ